MYIIDFALIHVLLFILFKPIFACLHKVSYCLHEPIIIIIMTHYVPGCSLTDLDLIVFAQCFIILIIKLDPD